jgi:hypothetical protein
MLKCQPHSKDNTTYGALHLHLIGAVPSGAAHHSSLHPEGGAACSISGHPDVLLGA